MTPEHIEKHRKRFEALMLKRGQGTVRHYKYPDRYWNEHQQSQWEGYLLHAENQIVRLPELATFGPNYHDYNDGIESCKFILESQGIKIKSSGSE